MKAGSFTIGPLLLVLCLSLSGSSASAADSLFTNASAAYGRADYTAAARMFRQAAARQPATGVLQNLGNAEWQRGQVGQAVLAWEQSLWLDSFNERARNNLKLARKVAQLETPDLAWYEVISSWLPVNWWAWITGASLWLAIGIGLLPGILRLRKSVWQQAAAAFGLALFLLSAPALYGVHTRSHMGFVLQKNTPLRLTPTAAAQEIWHLGPGEGVRVQSARGNYLLVRTRGGRTGWLERGELGVMVEMPAAAAAVASR
jgi:tetratricopeptide (TPR) repeat protein